MRALVCRAFVPYRTMQVEEMPDPEVRAGDLLIEVLAAGVSFTDRLIVEGEYQTKPPLPFVPGTECAGVVRALGDGVTGFAVGDRVCATPFFMGALAEQVAVPEIGCFHLPEDMSFLDAAMLPNAYFTAYHALVGRAALRSDEAVLVLGAAGSLGIAAIQIAKALGARVIAAASSASKLEVARACGADVLVDYGREDLRTALRAALDGGGLDIVFDPVGGAMTEPALRSLGWGGRLLVVGFAAGDIPLLKSNLALLSERSVLGVLYGGWAWRNPEANRRYADAIIALYRDKGVRPVIGGTFALEDFRNAFAALTNRETVGKIAVTFS